MKYSPEQTSRHIEVVYEIVSKDPSMSARALCYYLKEKGHNLNRAYATKLMWKAFARMNEEEKNLRERRPQFDQWKARFETVIHEVDLLRASLRQIITEYPGDWIDPSKRHDRYY